MQLSKRIPARMRVLKARWCKKEFTVMGPDFRRARARMRSKMDTCHWCRHRFEDGETMALASFVGKGGNKMLCQSCAEELLASGEDEDGNSHDG